MTTNTTEISKLEREARTEYKSLAAKLGYAEKTRNYEKIAELENLKWKANEKKSAIELLVIWLQSGAKGLDDFAEEAYEKYLSCCEE